MSFVKFIFLILLIAASGVIFLYPQITAYNLGTRLAEIREEVKKIDLEEIKKEVLAPPPLRSDKSVPNSVLTDGGVVNFTNGERRKAGLPEFTENGLLNKAASLKIKDMLEKQYFAHVSPTGEGIETVAEITGYAYITIGENLALGDFENDKDLVDGWMASPGHRANILNARFSEIGVAVGKGVLDGRFTWLAVQVFAKPLSACPEPDENLKKAIDLGNEEATILQEKLEALRAQIEAMNPRKEREEYNKRVDEYNALVAQYNALVDQIKTFAARFNAEVKSFNECAGN